MHLLAGSLRRKNDLVCIVVLTYRRELLEEQNMTLHLVEVNRSSLVRKVTEPSDRSLPRHGRQRFDKNCRVSALCFLDRSLDGIERVPEKIMVGHWRRAGGLVEQRLQGLAGFRQ